MSLDTACWLTIAIMGGGAWTIALLTPYLLRKEKEAEEAQKEEQS